MYRLGASMLSWKGNEDEKDYCIIDDSGAYAFSVRLRRQRQGRGGRSHSRSDCRAYARTDFHAGTDADSHSRPYADARADSYAYPGAHADPGAEHKYHEESYR